MLGSWAGARRTESAYPQYLAVTHAADYLVSTESSGTAPTIAFYHRVERLPGVERSGLVAGPSLVSETDGKPDADLARVVKTLASEDGRAGYSVAGYRLIAGRMPQPDQPFEALANRTLANQRHLQVGSRFTMYRTPLTSAALGSDAAPKRLVPVTFTITGIGVSSDEVVPIAPNDGGPTMVVTPAYDQRYDRGIDVDFDGAFVRLKPAVSHPAFVADVERLARTFPQAKDLDGIFVADLSSHAARVERSIHPEALALALFAALVALGALLTVGQIIARDIVLASSEDRVLVAMGFDRRQLVSVPLVRLAVPIVIGALLAVVGCNLGLTAHADRAGQDCRTPSGDIVRPGCRRSRVRHHRARVPRRRRLDRVENHKYERDCFFHARRPLSATVTHRRLFWPERGSALRR